MRLAISLVCVVFGGAACGSEANQGADVGLDIAFNGDAPDTRETQSSYSVVTLCDGLARSCCKLDECIMPGQVAPDCVAQTRTLCTDTLTGPLLTHLDQGELSFNPDAAEGCYGAFDAATCDDISNLTGDPPAGCGAAFIGTIAEGAACPFDAVCAPGLFCKAGADGTCPGTCAKRKALGEACNAGNALCASDLACTSFQATVDGVCVTPKVARGAACVAGSQCQEGVDYCDTTAHVCKARLGVGAACPNHNECDFRAGLMCAGATGSETCVARPGENAACDGVCADGFVCAFDSKVCVKEPALGDDCVDAVTGCGHFNGLQCDPATQKCIAWLALGAACGGPNAPQQCLGGYCDGDFQTAGHCAPSKHLGDACEGFNQCGKLACVDGHCAVGGNPCRGPGRLDQCNP